MRKTVRFPRAFCFALLLAIATPIGARAAAPENTVAAQQAPPSDRLQPDAGGTAQAPAYSLPREKLASAIAFSRIRNILGFVETLWSIGFLLLLLASGAASRLDAWARRVSPQPAIHGLLFFASLIVLINLADMPLRWYGHRVSVAYGLSVSGWAYWLADHGKSLFLTLMISAPLMLLLHWIMRRSPRHYWLWAWVISLPLGTFGVFAAPLRDRMFNRFDPLAQSHPALVAQLEKVVARTGTSIPSDRMFLMDASARSTGLNAYVTGIGATKSIVVWDTTVRRIPEDEILYIFGHESGHYVLNHIPLGMALGEAGFLLALWVSAGLTAWSIRRFGGRWGVQSASSLSGFVVLLAAFALVGFFAEPIGNTYSRHVEHEADVYGQEAIHGIVADPRKTAVRTENDLGEAWLEDPNPNPFIEFWSYSHPSTQHRAQFAAAYDPWANGGRGRFFAK